ncbi:hypothetical protein LOK49_LG04G02341 [Camellia lanceoleosa]|uniref:Uncharacterized protein n=1 Tax=Camellia lanceoleosa TaxID=1840588 RepID=A0ACC0I8W3_9ERIC|nr:hypothetical protein LOK49_LG04G02341 [Camellia lanceoleosa]
MCSNRKSNQDKWVSLVRLPFKKLIDITSISIQGQIIGGGVAKQFVEIVVFAEISKIDLEEFRVLNEAFSVEEDIGMVFACVASYELFEFVEKQTAEKCRDW